MVSRCTILSFDARVVHIPNQCGCEEFRPKDAPLVCDASELRLDVSPSEGQSTYTCGVDDITFSISNPSRIYFHPTNQMLNISCMSAIVMRKVSCKTGNCGVEELWVDNGYFGNGTALAPGDYRVSVPDQRAIGFSVCDYEGAPIDLGKLFLVVEPLSDVDISVGIMNNVRC